MQYTGDKRVKNVKVNIMMPFSVSETSKVVFSPVNLQYQPSTGTWRFAENQYDLVDANTDRHETTIYIADYDGWIDLFGWGTSGWDGGSAVAYQPYSTSTTHTDYGPTGMVDLTGDNVQYDWGVHNAINNGGNAAGLWRTLAIDEWNAHVGNWALCRGTITRRRQPLPIRRNTIVGRYAQSYPRDCDNPW